MVTVEEIREIESALVGLRGAVSALERIKDGKVGVENPVTRERVLIDVPAAKVDALKAKVLAALSDLKSRTAALKE